MNWITSWVPITSQRSRLALGKIRERIEEFIVDEIPKHADLATNGEYTHFNLEENWETISAARVRARSFGVSYRRFGYATTALREFMKTDPLNS